MAFDKIPMSEEEKGFMDFLTRELGAELALKILKETPKGVSRDFVRFQKEAKDSEKVYAFTKGTFDALMKLLKMQATMHRVAVQLETKRHKNFEERVAALEGKSLGYCGVWDSAKEYSAGSVVSFQGSMWHSNVRSTGTRPGTSDAWTLCVKAGRPGKDAR